MNKIEKPGYRHYVHFTLKWIVVHLGAMLIQSFFAGYFAQSVYDEKIHHARRISLLISLLAIFAFCIYEALRFNGDNELRKAFRERCKTEDIPLPALAKMILKKHLIHTAIFAVFQLPYMIFYSFFGAAYVGSILFEDFFCIEMGIYEITGIGIVGLIMGALLFFALQIALDLLTFHRWKKDTL